MAASPQLRADLARAVLLVEEAQTTDADRAADGHPVDDGSTTDAPLEPEHPSTPTLRDRIRAERERLQAVIDTKGARRG
jgi:hypothetical protein